MVLMEQQILVEEEVLVQVLHQELMVVVEKV